MRAWRTHNENQLFLREYGIVSQIYPFFPCGLCPHAGRRFTVSYGMKPNGTLIYSASHFKRVEGAQGFIVRFIFVFSRANGKPHRQIRAKKRTFIVRARAKSLTGFAPYGG